MEDIKFLISEEVHRIISESSIKKPPLDLDHLKELTYSGKGVSGGRFDKLFRYVEKTNAPLIGAGGDRAVYAIDKDRVLKLAINATGQNRAEFEHSRCFRGTPYFPIILDYDHQDYLWLVSERAHLFKSFEEFDQKLSERLNTKTNAQELENMLRTAYMFNNDEHDIEEYINNPINKHFRDYQHALRHLKIYRSNQWYKGLVDILTQCHVQAGDLHFKNWGYMDDGRLVIVDTGFFY